MKGAKRVGGGGCFHCGERATLLCDGVLGWRRAWYQRQPVSHPRFRDRAPAEGWWCIDTSRDGEEMVTCDRPLCDDCATRAGVTFWCGEDGGVETIDHCRDCTGRTGVRAPLLDDETLDALRRRRLIRADTTQNAQFPLFTD